eukprot:13309417-Alexandrium_andersonii.AAC.1
MPPPPVPPGSGKKDLPALRIKYRERISAKVTTAKLEAIVALDGSKHLKLRRDAMARWEQEELQAHGPGE